MLSVNIDSDTNMRAIFTQFSLLVAIMTIMNLSNESTSPAASITWGLAVGCLVYLILLLGDYSVHRLLEKSNETPAFRFRDQPIELEMFDDVLTANEPSGSEFPVGSQSDQLAA